MMKWHPWSICIWEGECESEGETEENSLVAFQVRRSNHELYLKTLRRQAGRLHAHPLLATPAFSSTFHQLTPILQPMQCIAKRLVAALRILIIRSALSWTPRWVHPTFKLPAGVPVVKRRRNGRPDCSLCA